MNKALKTWYNPGLLTTVLLFVPISLYYLYLVVQNDSTPDIADRYPLNNMSALWTNWGTTLFMYLPPIIFPNTIWLGLVPMIFGGVAQLLIHGIVNKKMLKSRYNAGLATTLFGHFPLFVAYVYHIEVHQLVIWWEYLLAAVLIVAWYVGVIRIVIPKLWEDKNSPYPFNPAQMAKFDRLYPQMKK
ncbi:MULTISPECIES: HXXEE domain-containing protein [Pasteurellaceae]|uniref:HXXEE domain-containing protein n=1 Tax=Pasteurellaceae TaxID=712 RepID=UPI003569E17A